MVNGKQINDRFKLEQNDVNFGKTANSTYTVLSTALKLEKLLRMSVERC